jgi:hypothetical protein
LVRIIIGSVKNEKKKHAVSTGKLEHKLIELYDINININIKKV